MGEEVRDVQGQRLVRGQFPQPVNEQLDAEDTVLSSAWPMGSCPAWSGLGHPADVSVTPNNLTLFLDGHQIK